MSNWIPIVGIVIAVAIVLLYKYAPWGYEDDEGFHYGTPDNKPSKAHCDGGCGHSHQICVDTGNANTNQDSKTEDKK